MKYKLILLILLCSAFVGKAQPWDNIPLDSLTFTSEAERAFFSSKQLETTEDWVKAALVTDGAVADADVTAAVSSISKLISKLEKKKIAKKDYAEKANMIHNALKELYFKSYKDDAKFGELFTSNSFNNTTATVLHAIFLEHFEIDYVVQNEWVALSIMIPNTEYAEGVCWFESFMLKPVMLESYEDKMVSKLVRLHYITKEERVNTHRKRLWKEYFDFGASLTKSEVISMLYFNQFYLHVVDNQGLEYDEKADIVLTLEKSFYLYPSLHSRLFLVEWYHYKLSEPYKKKQYKYTLRVFKLDNSPKRDTINVRSFNHRIRALYNSVDDSTFFSKQAERYRAVTKGHFKREFKSIYYARTASLLFGKGDDRAGEEYAIRGRLQNGTSGFADSIFIMAIIHKIKSMGNPAKRLEALEAFPNNFPELSKDTLFSWFLGAAYLEYATHLFKNDDGADALTYLDKFEAITPEISVDQAPPIFASAYDAGWAYYIRMGSKSKAKAMLERGLKICPDSKELRRKLRDYH